MEPNVPGTKLPTNTAYLGPHRHLKRRTLRRFDSICGEQVATCGYQLGTLRGQPQAPSHMIEKPNTKLSLQIL
jgi:hypothetical protein